MFLVNGSFRMNCHVVTTVVFCIVVSIVGSSRVLTVLKSGALSLEGCI